MALTAACQGGSRTTVPSPEQRPPTQQPAVGSLGFDTRVYPGDAALSAWKFPSSPYRWIGYYLAAPCHRDASFVGKYSTLTVNGWGVAALYVGQQDWANSPSNRPPAPASDTTSKPAGPIICSATLLNSAQGTAEAADAVTKMSADGFPDGSTIYLDIERVTTVSQALMDYYRAWMSGVLRDGRYRPGVYVTKANAPAFHDIALTTSDGAAYAPSFWIAAAGAIDSTTKPTDVGFDYARIWQSAFDVTQTFNGVSLRIDVNVGTP
jgi:hypothetical protein